MRGYVANTDWDWFRYLRARARRGMQAAFGDAARMRSPRRHEWGEVNFWIPSGRNFRVLEPGWPLFFRLKGGIRAIGGFGLFVHFTRLPLWLA